jgi:hypothetical protein
LIRVAANNFLRSGNTGRAAHEINRNRCDGLGLVIVDLHRLVVIEEIDILILCLIARAAEFLPRLLRGHADTYPSEFGEQWLFAGFGTLGI